DKKSEAMKEFAPYLNSVTGASIDETAAEFIFDNMTILRGWTGQSEFWNDQNNPVYYKNIFDPQIKKLIADGAIKDQLYDLDEVFIAKKVWEDMRAMQREAADLLGKGASGLPDDKQALFQAAQ